MSPAGNKVKIWQNSLSPTFFTLSHPKGHVMSAKWNEPIDDLNLQSKFGYCIVIQTFNIALCLYTGRNYGRTVTADPIRCPGYIAPRLVYDPVPSGSGFSFSIHHWQCAFLAQILQKIQLSLSEFKRLDLHSRLHRFASFFQNFLGGGPPNPHLQEGRSLPYPPPLGPSGLDNPPPPRLASGSATEICLYRAERTI